MSPALSSPSPAATSITPPASPSTSAAACSYLDCEGGVQAFRPPLESGRLPRGALTAMGELAPHLKPRVQLFTDGACVGNPGPGGWAFILHHPATGRRKEGSGGELATTNNRMEITAVIRGIEALRRPSRVELFSDSEYVVNAVNGWMAKR